MALESSRTKRLHSIFVLDSMGSRSHTLLNHISRSPDLHTVYHPYVHASKMGENRWIKSARVSEAHVKEILEDMLQMVVENCDFDTAYKKWCEKYGQFESSRLRRLAERDLLDYEYLSQFKI